MKKYFTLMLATVSISIMLVGCGSSYPDIEESAKPVVNQIIKENFGANSANCEAVKVTEKVSDSFYKAVAILDNGKEVKITIKVTGNQIYVTVLE